MQILAKNYLNAFAFDPLSADIIFRYCLFLFVAIVLNSLVPALLPLGCMLVADEGTRELF